MHLPASVSYNQPPPAVLPEGPLMMEAHYVIFVTKYRRLSGLGNKIYFLAVPEVGKFKITVLGSSVTGEGSCPSSQMATSPCVLTWQSELSGVSRKDTNPVGSGPTSAASFDLHSFLTPDSHTGVRAST